MSSRGFLRCALGAAALLCTATQAAGPAALDPHGLWRVDQAESEPILDRRHARIDFGPGGRLTGHTSCNPMTAEYTLDGSVLEIGAVTLTTNARCGELQMQQEDRILTALEHVVSARVRDDGLLELRDRDGRGLLRGTRFTAEDSK
jgi:heat shock protein HslJ